MEWYRTALTVVPVGASVSPDVGSVFGSDGFLDFYVNGKGYSWGVELLREGDRMHGHARSFEPGGEYNKIPLTDYVIIDSRHENKTVQTPLPHFWHALYTDDYEHITIRRSGEKDKVLILGGDTEL
ncbi:hypothetical protein BC936DRAFT_136697 [Jimgerdemannia flammicorona]|uniref:Uncharacterized protein n=1 Tax=Jimgerdemannia flammicorona TaxID=994334 RepID=A0A433CYZ0_9FUNG|nr:hypothetical protein BC936DRAFT_136697 [Jimgerdemannia flammicorona]